MLGIVRSSVYLRALAANDNDLKLLRGSTSCSRAGRSSACGGPRRCCRPQGVSINRKRVQRLMRRMGIAALGHKPRTTKPAPGHTIYPYLLRDVTVERANPIWAADITYTPMGRRCLYLVAVMDWVSRSVLAPRLSNTMGVSFCVSTLEEAVARFGRPEIFNTDQGSQLTSAAFTCVLAAGSSMRGRLQGVGSPQGWSLPGAHQTKSYR